MALVYRAKDMLLNRNVAVKVLRPQFSNDEEFIQRFRREAQSAASLSHPNVVNIYDVGDTGEIHFIVMEFVQGHNLSELIRNQKQLGEEEVVSIAIQIALALSHAHQHGLVHRDIKPHNILITKDGRVKVTDFGIAQAMSAANLTQTGMVLGSVNYFSPEQARGTNIQSKTDLYSLGIVMYEMLTGRVPFRGDTPIAVALKQIQENPIPLRQIRSDINSDLERIVLRLLAKEQAQRPESAETLVADLRIVLETLQEAADTQLTRKLQAVDPTEEEMDMPSPKRSKRKKKGKRNLPRIILVIILFFAVGWAIQWVIPQLLFPDEVTVPNIVGLNSVQAEALLAERGLVLAVDLEVFDNEVPAGVIISQEPVANRRVKQNRAILVRLSKGAEYVGMPDVVGLPLREARLTLTQAGFTLGEEDAVFNPEVVLNTVIAQEPAAEERVQKGIPVRLVVSRGREDIPSVTLPDFRGQSLESAREELRALGLEVGNTWPEYSTLYSQGQIIEQNPNPGSAVELGWTIDFVYSQGAPQGTARQTAPDEEEPDAIKEWSTQGQWQSVEVVVNVPEGPQQEVVILVIDDFGAREVFREMRNGGSRVVRTIQGRGDGAKIQVYIGGRMFLDRYFRD